MTENKNKKVILIGCSIPNLYAAKKLKEFGFKISIYEKKSNFNNEQIRRLPILLLKKLEIKYNLNNKFEYIKLTKLKQIISKNLFINYNCDIKIDFDKLEFKYNDKDLEFDFIIINTKYNPIQIQNSKIHTYNYLLDNSKNNFSGNSLMNSIKKVDEIINEIKDNN